MLVVLWNKQRVAIAAPARECKTMAFKIRDVCFRNLEQNSEDEVTCIFDRPVLPATQHVS